MRGGAGLLGDRKNVCLLVLKRVGSYSVKDRGEEGCYSQG